ncbi:MAG TPA: DUF1638 domain-containing protein [Bacillota bacterium]|nr:DUF1638 domain-containing protein [Bacillota bacterium]
MKLIGCASTRNEVAWLNLIPQADCCFLDYSYHANPDKLRRKLQELIEASQDYDLLVLTFSRCANSLVGLRSPRVPMVFPRTHDCFGLMLGSDQKHQTVFRGHVGTYYFSQGWLDYGRTPLAEYQEYREKYGEKKAHRLIMTLYGRYNQAMLVITPGMKDIDHYRRQVQEIADFFGWATAEMEGTAELLEAVLRGQVSEEIVYIEPGVEVTEEVYSRSPG